MTWCAPARSAISAARNFSGWHLFMKSLAISDRNGLARYVAHQAYHLRPSASTTNGSFMPLALDQHVSAVVGARWAGPPDGQDPPQRPDRR